MYGRVEMKESRGKTAVRYSVRFLCLQNHTITVRSCGPLIVRAKILVKEVLRGRGARPWHFRFAQSIAR
jgi:hypothetical protein